MAKAAGSVFLFLALASMTGVCEGGCYPTENVIRMCTRGTLTANRVYIDANVTVGSNEECSCTVTQTQTGNLYVSTIFGSVTECGTDIQFFKPPRALVHSHWISCSYDEDYLQNLDANSLMAFNLTGNGRANICAFMEATLTNSQLTVECFDKTTNGTIATPPTTQPPQSTSQAPQTSSQPPQTPSQPPQTSSQPPQTPSQPPQTPSQPPQTPSQPPQTPSQPPQTSSQPPQTPSQPPQTPSQPSQTPSQPPQTPSQQTSTQPSQTSMQPPASSTQPPATPTQPSSSTVSAVPGTTEALYRFPVPEVAGGVAAAIFVIIFLVVCVTCCASKRRSKRKPDEESLRGRESPEMQERKEGRGYAFDNLLYHASQRDLTGKTVTPTPSDADHSDYQATKALSDLYASVSKQITESTDIM